MNLNLHLSLRIAAASALTAGAAFANSDPITISYDKTQYEPGEFFEITIKGEPGILPFVLFDSDPGPTAIMGLGSLDIGFSSGFFFNQLKPIPSNGIIVGTCDLNCEIVGMPLYTQVVGANLALGELCLSNSISLNYNDSLGVCEPCFSTIGDFVWEDTNGNGIQESGEPGIEGATLILKNAAGTEIATAMTDMNGAYQFTGICPGTYTVEVDPASVPDYLPTDCEVGNDTTIDSNCSPATVVIVNDGDDDPTIDFGFTACDECKGGVTNLTFEYQGADDALVEVFKDDQNSEEFFAGVLSSGDSFSIVGTGSDNKLPKTIKLYIDGVEVADPHTSCSQPIGPGTTFDSFVVLAAVSKDNGPVCPEIQTTAIDCSAGKPFQLTFTYTGLDCSSSMNGQGGDKFDCDDLGALIPTVHIVAFKKADQIYFEGDVAVGDTFTIDAGALGASSLKSNTFVTISDLNGNLLQDVKFHTSCSVPLAVGDVFGALSLEVFVPEP